VYVLKEKQLVLAKVQEKLLKRIETVCERVGIVTRSFKE
jgi:hypothetical protein